MYRLKSSIFFEIFFPRQVAVRRGPAKLSGEDPSDIPAESSQVALRRAPKQLSGELRLLWPGERLLPNRGTIIPEEEKNYSRTGERSFSQRGTAKFRPGNNKIFNWAQHKLFPGNSNMRSLGTATCVPWEQQHAPPGNSKRCSLGTANAMPGNDFLSVIYGTIDNT